MSKAVKYSERAVTILANGAWSVFERVNRIKPNASFTPKWSDKPLLKSWQKSKPTLGWPRTTDSLCPGCVTEARDAIINGTKDWMDLARLVRSSYRLRASLDRPKRVPLNCENSEPDGKVLI